MIKHRSSIDMSQLRIAAHLAYLYTESVSDLAEQTANHLSLLAGEIGRVYKELRNIRSSLPKKLTDGSMNEAGDELRQALTASIASFSSLEELCANRLDGIGKRLISAQRDPGLNGNDERKVISGYENLIAGMECLLDLAQEIRWDLLEFEADFETDSKLESFDTAEELIASLEEA